MSSAEAPRPARQRGEWRKRFRREPSRGEVLLCLIGITAVSTAVCAALVTLVQAPTVFSDEIGYMKLALSIGRDGRLALFNDPGLSYSPLYPALLSPIYAFGASAPTAYGLMKIVNALLMSLSVFPIYKIARFALPRRFSLLVAGLSALLPLMLYPSFTMSENLAYPVCLVAVWAMLRAVQTPSAHADVLLLAAIAVATAARIQLIVLAPAALTAILLAAAFERESGENLRQSLLRAARAHWLLVGTAGAVLVVAGAGVLAGYDVLAAFGRYADVGRRGFPNIGDLLNLLVRHLAGVDLALGVVPFVGALVAGYVFVRSSNGRSRYAFAAVAVSVTGWLLLEVAVDAALFDEGDIPRIHERFLIYVAPLFLVALVAAYRLPASKASENVYRVAVAIAALLPVVIPFDTVVNQTISFESLGLHPYARVVDGRLAAVPHATFVAVFVAALLGLLYMTVRERLQSIVILVLLPWVFIWGQGIARIESSSEFARSLLPAHTDWVDRTKPDGEVILVTGETPATPELQTAYHNLSIARVYSLCGYAFGAEFGERPATIDEAGRLRDEAEYIAARYVVAPAALGIRGRVVARNRRGREVLVAPRDGRVALDPVKRATLDCSKRRRPVRGSE